VRLPPQANETIDRSRRLTFTFEGEPIEAYEGDTVASALFAAGRRIFSRSFKYHRPRGLLCCSGRCPNCLLEVDGVPNVRACMQPATANARVRAQNVVGSLDSDLMSFLVRVGSPFLPVGFYYRTMIRPRWAWPYFERFLRNAAGLGRLDEHARRTQRYDVEHRRADVLVIGGGDGGTHAAAEARARGEEVVVVDERGRGDVRGTAIGIYEGGLVPVAADKVLYRYRAGRIVVAAGAGEQPLVFPGNDLVGVYLPEAIRRLVGDWALKPGERAVVVGQPPTELEQAGVEIVRVADQSQQIAARGRFGKLRNVIIDGEAVACDLLVVDGGRQPAFALLAQAGATVEYDAARGIFVPRSLPEGIDAAGKVTGEGCFAPPVSAPSGGKEKSFVCLCEDVTTKDVKRAIAEGFDSIELIKRYTTVTMGPCQGRLCQLSSIRLCAAETGLDEAAIGTTTARPPWRPVELGLLAGRPHEPTKRTAIHHRHKEAGATIMWTGAWRRPHSYGDPAAEVRAVHERVGVIDVSTLGKLLVSGPDAVSFLERLYPNRFADLRPGRIRYGVLGNDAGRIMDDGTIARLSEDSWYVTTTSTGADSVLEWCTWWNAVWQMDVRIESLTGALAAVNVAGPRSRDLLARLTDLDLSNGSFAYLDAKRAEVADLPCLLLRIGFVGELGYELHCPSPYGEHLWDRILEAGADLGCTPFGLEPQRVLRLEKMHILVGQDTDSESNAIDAGMPWLVKLEKDDFVGRWSLERIAAEGGRERLVGFVMENGSVPLEGGQVVVDGRSVGRITSARWSNAVGAAIGMAWVPAELAIEDVQLDIRRDRTLERARVRLQPFYDPEGKRLRS
jgi:sarcosine oxidase, subunit alpha